MTHTITLKELRPELPHVADAVFRKMERYIVTRRGKPVMTILSPEDYEGLLETIEILSDRSAVRRIRKALKEARRGKVRSLEEIRSRLERVSH
ncbi:MAG: type II toxin-antitoxin system Phd/YefM family antitoxin [Elusimicrobia bacterium]|nr:type II toxin-antitoxin system Phd/YefM family antitoxin [Elusimicrobiota bacterium]